MKLLGVAVLQPDIQNIKLLGGGGGGWTDRKMRQGIPKLMFSLRSLLKKILKHVANFSSQQTFTYLEIKLFWFKHYWRVFVLQVDINYRPRH